MEASGSSRSPDRQGKKKKPRLPPRRSTEERPHLNMSQTEQRSNELGHQGTKPKMRAERDIQPQETPFVNTGERRSVIEEDCYESMMDEPQQKKRPERRTEILSPAGGIITSAEILNARADQFGWLWRKERIFRSR